jgi:phage terminase large subunit-like protein
MAIAHKVKELAEADLKSFAKLINPKRIYGQVHLDVYDKMQEAIIGEVENLAVLMPRDHQKSHQAAVACLWALTRDPTSTHLYISSTAALAEAQLRAIKDMMESPIYSKYWPTMIHRDVKKRAKWTNDQILVDHPSRKDELVRDPSIKAVGLTGSITGFHANYMWLDDMVEPNNAYTETGRADVRARYSQLASIETTGSRSIVVGTKYHPADLYTDLRDMVEPILDDNDDVVGERNVYEFKIEVVEEDGVFLWPREARADGKLYGFNAKELARKKAKYLDKTQFFAQYYQETNHADSQRLTYSNFQYYDVKFLSKSFGSWKFKGNNLNVYASIDFAFTLNKRSDFTAIVVIGVDSDNNIYILDIDRFKTDKIQTLYEKIADLHSRWNFRKLRAEVNGAQGMIAKDLKDRMRMEGMMLSIETHSPSRHEGNKAERIAAVLEPRYENGAVWHFQGGHTPVLEEELMLARPQHDDVKDALASVVEVARPPMSSRFNQEDNVVVFNSKWGGVGH